MQLLDDVYQCEPLVELQLLQPCNDTTAWVHASHGNDHAQLSLSLVL